ncbi:hypothetical protein BDW75DRAFT_230267 [Aspergillus navahoensis]
MTLYDKFGGRLHPKAQRALASSEVHPKGGEPPTTALKRDLLALLGKHAKDGAKLEGYGRKSIRSLTGSTGIRFKRGQEAFFRYGVPIRSHSCPRLSKLIRRNVGVNPAWAMARLLHSSVWSRILILVKERPDYYDLKAFGIPISDFDCIKAINTFSTRVAWISLPRQGIYLQEREIEDYIALRRLVMYYMGSPHEVFEDKPTAKAFMEIVLYFEKLTPNRSDKFLRKTLPSFTTPSFASKHFMKAMARHLNGDKQADGVDIPKTSLYYQTFMYGYCYLVIMIAYMNRVFPLFDKARIAVRRKVYYLVITDKEHGLGGETILQEVLWFAHHKARNPQGKKGVEAGYRTSAQIGVLAVCTSAATVIYRYGAAVGLRLLDQ